MSITYSNSPAVDAGIQRTGALRVSSLAVISAGLIGVPLIALVVFALSAEAAVWQHLIDTFLLDYILNTLALALGVGVGVLMLGVGAAWLVAMYQFPGRNWFEWGLMLPLAAPSYIVAFVYTDFLDYAGPVQTWLRTTFGWSSASQYAFPEIRSLGGAIIVMSLVLYPYVYLLARTAFLSQSRAAVEAARTLGMDQARAFWRVALPMARPAIAVGLALAMMETLNEYGTVDFFAVQVFSTGIYHVWLNMGSLDGAAGLALMLVAVVALLVWLERRNRADRRFADPRHVRGASPRQSLTPGRAGLAFLACLLPVFLGFLLPFGLLLSESLGRLDTLFEGQLLAGLLSSLELAFLAALCAAGLALWLAYSVRVSGGRGPVVWAARFASIGYAVPGAVLAVGILFPFASFDNALDGVMRDWFGISTGLLLSGSIFALLFGCTVRFLALAYGATESGMERVSRNNDDAARLLGCTSVALVRRVHWPLIRASVLTGALLVFVDTMKELPMTMALRPFNFETLATLAHQYATDEQFAAAAPGALAIVLAGVVPVILMSRMIRGVSAPRASPYLIESI
ncbi:ABC transporter permease [Minwuia sp.]|uniref:ABC transporter permease n=1 Tax=Minwuia sp. TaxID=2493630 RepID=UPI003A8D8B8B